jgi:16S rRNA (uracil1498-N3)-methyltransferase
MELTQPIRWNELIARQPAGSPIVLADPSGVPFAPAALGGLGSVVLAVGPEGGFTSDELALASVNGAKFVSLGPRILRIETAALVLAAVIEAFVAPVTPP